MRIKLPQTTYVGDNVYFPGVAKVTETLGKLLVEKANAEEVPEEAQPKAQPSAEFQPKVRVVEPGSPSRPQHRTLAGDVVVDYGENAPQNTEQPADAEDEASTDGPPAAEADEASIPSLASRSARRRTQE